MIFRLVKTGRSYAVDSSSTHQSATTSSISEMMLFNEINEGKTLESSSSQGDIPVCDVNDCLRQLVLTEAELILAKAQITGDATSNRLLSNHISMLQKRVAFLKLWLLGNNK